MAIIFVANCIWVRYPTVPLVTESKPFVMLQKPMFSGCCSAVLVELLKIMFTVPQNGQNLQCDLGSSISSNERLQLWKTMLMPLPVADSRKTSLYIMITASLISMHSTQISPTLIFNEDIPFYIHSASSNCLPCHGEEARVTS